MLIHFFKSLRIMVKSGMKLVLKKSFKASYIKRLQILHGFMLLIIIKIFLLNGVLLINVT